MKDRSSPLLIFDFGDGPGEDRRRCFVKPVRVVETNSLAEVRAALKTVQTAVESGLHAAGYLTYEAAPAFDTALVVNPRSRMPLLWFGLFKEPIDVPLENLGDFQVSDWTPTTSRNKYDKDIAAIQEAIAAGQTYQVNYSTRLRASFTGDALAFYERHRAAQRSSYCAYLDTGRHQICSASPELFFRLQGEEIVTRPMKGTSRRGCWSEEDERLLASLIYCGAIGLIEPNGSATFNVPIRTVVIDSETGVAEYGVGGGITWESTSESEYEELREKSALLTAEMPEFELLETLKLTNSEYELSDRHLERLCASARYFNIPLSVKVVNEALMSHAIRYLDECRRVQLLISRQGSIRVKSEPLNQLPASPISVILADRPISKGNPFLFHKTTYRSFYDQIAKDTRSQLTDADVFDVLLWNEDGELTEFTRGNLVVELDGQLLTPPLDCGLLPGSLRAELLAQGKILENVLTKQDLGSVKRVWFINNVRGWIEVRILF